MSSYDRYETSRRRQVYGASTRKSTFGHWIPLALTLTVATVGLVAWIWKERKESEEYDDDRKGSSGGTRPVSGPGTGGQGTGGPSGPVGGRPPNYGNIGAEQPPYGRGPEAQPVEDASMLARMSGALRRTPSPQQIIDGASRRVAAGVAAAGAVVGGALSSIREEDKRDFEDHSRWSEEAQTQFGPTSLPGAQDARTAPPVDCSVRQLGTKVPDKRKAVAIVISAEAHHHDPNEDEIAYLQEHAVGIESSKSEFKLTLCSRFYHTCQSILMMTAEYLF